MLSIIFRMVSKKSNVDDAFHLTPLSAHLYQGEMSLEHHEAVCKLIRATGYDASSTDKHPKNYPENFFGRFPLPSDVVRMLVQTLQVWTDSPSQTTESTIFHSISPIYF